MSKTIISLLAITILFAACSDPGDYLESLFLHPVKSSGYKLGLYTGANLPEVNGFFPDASLDNIDHVTLASGAETIHGIHCWHNSAGLSGTTILYFHGTSDNIDIAWPRVKLLYETGCNVFVIDYRGYGESSGTASLAGITEDADASLAYLVTQLGVSENKIVLYGFSIGSYPAAYLATKPSMQNAIGLVLEAPIGSAEIYIQDALLLPLTDHFLAHYLNNVERIKTVSIPYLWLHGKADTVNKWNTHGLALFDNCPSQKKYAWLVEGAGHSNVPAVLGGVDYSTYTSGVANFIAGNPPF
jgi:fermentation-respiration switch protein FrsA (DUF1100 family)